jgi:iron complex outermembrane receptor protein
MARVRFRVSNAVRQGLLPGGPAIVLMSIGAVTQAALAQDAGEQNDTGLQEVVVTAQRTRQNLLDVPLSLQAATGEQLQDLNIRNIADLQFTSPGFFVSESSGYTQIFVRGIGNSIFVGADPSVATYIDDVPRVYGSMVNSLLDIDRTELLKGAQGGLYGRNATGGVLNIITHQPDTEHFDGEARASYGEYNTRSAAGYVNVPLNDKIAFNASVEGDYHDPYIRNVQPPNPYTAAMFPGGSFLGNAATTAAALNSSIAAPPGGYANQNFLATDAKVLLKANDDFKITVAGDYADKHDSSGNAIVSTTPVFEQAALAGSLASLLGANPQLPPGFVTTPPKFALQAIGNAPVDTVDDGGSITAAWNAPGFDLTSISAYRFNHTSLITLPQLPPQASAVVEFHRRYFYQELRAVSKDSGPFHWLGGATYLATHVQGLTAVTIPPVVPNLPLGGTVDRVKDWSGYLQGGYDITAALNLTASGRYVHETNNATYSLPPSPATGFVETKFLPSATLSYKFDGGGNVYARWARGFKAGGINPTTPPQAFPDPYTEGGIFKGEQVDTYEVGYRVPLLEHTLDLTTAIFDNEYKDIQTTVHVQAAYANSILEGIVNVGSARTWGAEESLNWKVINPLTVGVSAGYLNAKYTDFVVTNSTVLVPFDYSGHTMINSPKFQLSLTASLDRPLTDRLHLVGSLLESYTDKTIFIQSGLPGVLPDADGPAYWITNARLGIRTSDGKYEISAYANNLFNTAYYTYGTSAAATGNALIWGNPRVVGGEIDIKF